MDLIKNSIDVKSSATAEGTWDKVLGCSKVDGQPGIWLNVAGGSAYYYNPSSDTMQSLAFTACSDPKNYQISVLIPQNGPAAGLFISCGS
ncbi:hypothetical protein [Roseibium litorale]|uniref:Uncharacterized protein n=1 Tax=Roseibium litorale TaxID=2803841 RepID=A0ABR9CGD7_9HYPH|nr:hypothetical protein [Roseibium litorale]MBD8889966.1 hypothetical protein [Roseibium litorale]